MRKNGKWVLLIVLGVFALLFCLQAAAQSENASTLYKSTTVYDIPEDSISVDPNAPNGTRVDCISKAQFKNLIQIRENFRAKVLSSAKSL
jgi:ABC-type oligopeptide transport system substrate-binding subunit